MNNAAVLIDGKKLAEQLLEDIRKKTSTLKRSPTLAIILVGNESASKIYVNAKKRACGKVGVRCEIFSLDEKASESDVIEQIRKLNNNEKISGIILQLPLPRAFAVDKIVNTIDTQKDVDGLTVKNNKFTPATAKAVVRILTSLDISLEGKKATVIGRSKLVGKPVAGLLKELGCDVTVCHSKTTDLSVCTIEADILVSAVGKRDLVTKNMVKRGAVVIDIGITREGKRLFGDVSYNVREVAGFLTPVPGGVGPLTVACLLENVVGI